MTHRHPASRGRRAARTAAWSAAVAVLVLACSAFLGFRPAVAGDRPEEPTSAPVIPANDEEKAQGLAAAQKAIEEKDDAALAAALRFMQERRHAEFEPIIRDAVGSKQADVQAAAIAAAASHELKDLEKTVRKIFKTKPRGKDAFGVSGKVAAACIDYFARLGIEGEGESVLKEWLSNTLLDERRIKQSWAGDVIKASVAYIGRTKYKPGVPFLIDEMIAHPEPVDVNDGKNPPATYWEARTKMWQDYEGWARWALKEITGEEYRSAREWKAWLKLQDKKEFK